MIQCSACGRPIEKVPDWLRGTKVDFICNNCPNRQTKNIAFMTLDTEPKAKREDDDDMDVEEMPDEDED
jgi:hypothetical protein